MADYDEAIRLDPRLVHAYANRGSVYTDKQDYDHALVDLDQAIRLDPEFAQAYYNRGVIYSIKQDYDRAIAAIIAQGGEPICVGLAFSMQEVASVPVTPLDKPMHAIITESGFRRFC